MVLFLGGRSTIHIIDIIRTMVENGELVDCIDVWDHKEMCPVSEEEVEVDLSIISNEEFRFFENHHFVFKSSI